MRLENNFQVRMRDEHGATVPGTLREGHNVFTAFGREELAKLLTFSSLSPLSPDVPNSERRIRYVGVGEGTQSESLEARTLKAPITTDVGVYLREIQQPEVTFPTVTSVLLTIEFNTEQISWAAPQIVSEAGLYMDVSPDGTLNPGVGNNPVAFYLTFEPIMKLLSFSMELRWELRF